MRKVIHLVIFILPFFTVLSSQAQRLDRLSHHPAQGLSLTEQASGVKIDVSRVLTEIETVILAAPMDSQIKLTLSNSQIITATCRELGIFRYNRLFAVDLSMNSKIAVNTCQLPVSATITFSDIPEITLQDTAAMTDALTPLLAGLVANPRQAMRWMQDSGEKTKETDDNWYDRQLKWFQLRSETYGLVRIDNQIDFSGVDPADIQVFEKGIAVPVNVIGQEDGQWDPGDSLQFWSQPYLNPDGTNNEYTDESVYWIAVASEPGLRMDNRPGNVPGGSPATAFKSIMTYDDPQVISDGEYYSDSIRAGETKRWDFQLPMLADTGSCQFTLRCFGMTSIVAADPDHHLIIRLNDVLLDDAWWDSVTEYVLDIPINRAILNEGTNTLSLQMPGDTAAGELDGAYLDWFTVQYPRELTAVNDALVVSDLLPQSQGLVSVSVDGFLDDRIHVWRLDTGSKLSELDIQSTGGEFSVTFTDTVNTDTKYYVFSDSAEQVPFTVAEENVSNLRDPEIQADYIVIVHPAFASELQPLVDLRQNDGYSVKVVQIEDIYDEFNAGVFSPVAIRSFLQYAWQQWAKPAPVATLLVGDASWDYKEQLPETRYTNFIPTYGKDWGGNAATSPYDRGPTDTGDLIYGEPMVDEQMVCVAGDDNLPDLMIGRMAVTTREELREIISRISRYESMPSGDDWWKRCYFINGGFTEIEHETFRSQADTLIETFLDASPAPWKPLKTYKNTTGHEHGIYTSEILAYLNRGVGLVNYFGHAGTWSWEAMLSFDDLDNLSHPSRPPFVASMTCNTSRFANPNIQCFGERFMASGSIDTGAVSVWGGCNFGGYWSDYYLSYFFFRALFQKEMPTFGHAILESKVENLSRYPSYSIIIEPYVLLGDPLLKPKRSFRPQILLSGYLDTHLTASMGGKLVLTALVTDANGLDDVLKVELLYAGEPTGLELFDDGQHGDFGEGDGVYGIALDIPQTSSGNITANLGVRATDRAGNVSGVANGVVSW